MTMSPGFRKLALTAHVTFSVGWLGAVAGFLALAIAGLTSPDARTVRSAYLAMELVGWTVIVPLSLASLLSGLVQSIGTTWGLFRHYWVVAKLLINVLATALLLVHMQPIGTVARAAADATLSGDDLREQRIQLVADAGAALVALLVATSLGVFKPRGLTPYGRRKLQEQIVASRRTSTGSSGSADVGAAEIGRASTATTPRWVYWSGLAVLVLVLLFVISHLTGGGFGHHARHGH